METAKLCHGCFQVLRILKFGLLLKVVFTSRYRGMQTAVTGVTHKRNWLKIRPSDVHAVTALFRLLHLHPTWRSRVITVMHSKAMPVSAVSITMLTFVQILSCISRRCAFFRMCACPYV